MPFFRSSDWHSHTNLWFHAEGFHMITLQPIPSSKDCNFLTNLLNLSPLKTRSDAFWEQWWFVGALFLKKKNSSWHSVHSIQFGLFGLIWPISVHLGLFCLFYPFKTSCSLYLFCPFGPFETSCSLSLSLSLSLYF